MINTCCRIRLLSILLISCLGTFVYSNTFFCSFHFDDEPFIIFNSAINNIFDLQSIWHYFHGRFFTFLSLAINYQINGLNVFGYHVFNLAVHLIAAILVWWLILLTLSAPALKNDKITDHAHIIALLAGLVFVCHPVQIEGVTYIWQRASSMVAMFYLASLCFYVKSRLLQINYPSSGPTRSYYIGSLITAVVAMFTKENAVTLPLMILFYEFTFLKDKRGIDWKFISPFLLMILIVPITFLFIKSQTFQSMHGNLRVPGGFITPMHYFLTQFRVMVTYIRLIFIPINQNIDYDYPIYKNIIESPVLISFLFLISIFYAAIYLFSKYRLVSFSIFWFFLTLTIPESSFWAMGDVIAEHRLYLPMVGYSMLLVSGAYYLWGKNSIKTMVTVLSLIIACYSVLAFQRNNVWKNDFTLWDDAACKSPHKARPFINRGHYYKVQGDLTQALSDYSKAIALDPDNSLNYFDRGVIYEGEGKFDQALIEYTKSLIINPNFSPSYNNRGFIYYKAGNYKQALIEYAKAIELDPVNIIAYYNRYQLYDHLKKYDQAKADFYRLKKFYPKLSDIQINAR